MSGIIAQIVDRFRDICIVAEKELRHCFRDSHVLIYTVLVPLVVYPIGLICLSEYTLWREGLAETRPIRIAFKKDGSEKIPELMTVVKDNKKIQTVECSDPLSDLQRGALEGVIDGSKAPEKVEVTLNPSSDRFLETKVLLMTLSFDARGKAMRKVIDSLHEKPEMARVFEVVTENVGTIGGKKAGFKDQELTMFSTTILLVGFYAYTLLIIAAGAVYPALAAFTEEFEKGTKSTTFLLPVERSSVVVGKFFAVSALSLFSGIVNFISMGAVFLYFTFKLPQIKQTIAMAAKQFSPANLLLLVFVFLLSALLIAAIYSLIAACSKSFKEAQNMCSLVLIVITIFPVASVLPGWTLDEKTFLIPVLNMVLASKCIVTDSLPVWPFVLACIESIALTAGFLYMAQSVFWGREPSLSGQNQVAGA